MKRPLKPDELSPAQVYTELGGILYKYAPEFIDRYGILPPLVDQIFKDLDAYVAKDPAAHKYPKLVYNEYKCFRAIQFYRVANALLKSGYNEEDEKELVERASRRIAEAAKVQTGVDIHPRAEIGEGFVIDHGIGVVIGETTQIGNNVTILNGVVLGGRRAANNPTGKRHPTIGNNVELCGNVKVFGPVTIGDGCFIGAGATVVEDVEPNMKVVLKAEVQITKMIAEKNTVERLSPKKQAFIAQLVHALIRYAAMLF